MLPQFEDGIYGFQGEYNFLSNFWPTLVKYEECIYPTVEHAYQAAKTLNVDERLVILACSTPRQAKKLGKNLTIRSNWEEVKVLIMEDLLRQKFSQDPLKSKLLLTFDKYIEETNTWGDTFWGVCDGKGQNVLGDLLMKIRKQMHSDKE